MQSAFVKRTYLTVIRGKMNVVPGARDAARKGRSSPAEGADSNPISQKRKLSDPPFATW